MLNNPSVFERKDCKDIPQEIEAFLNKKVKITRKPKHKLKP